MDRLCASKSQNLILALIVGHQREPTDLWAILRRARQSLLQRQPEHIRQHSTTIACTPWRPLHIIHRSCKVNNNNNNTSISRINCTRHMPPQLTIRTQRHNPFNNNTSNNKINMAMLAQARMLILIWTTLVFKLLTRHKATLFIIHRHKRLRKPTTTITTLFTTPPTQQSTQSMANTI